MNTATQDDSGIPQRVATTHPGLAVVCSGEKYARAVFPLVDGALELARDELAHVGISDGRASRRHLRVAFDGGRWEVCDLGSRNGTFLEGRRVERARALGQPLIRIGRTLLLAMSDYRPYAALGVEIVRGAVMGPALQAVHERIEVIARSTNNLLIHGGSGTGKELAATAFHTAAGAGGPFVAINCATLQRDLADRVLFGARRGAYTGAVADAVGLVQAAHHGTLFLDEIAELDPAVQAKLLRVLETRTVVSLGSVSPVPVDFRLCAATHKDLRAEVAAGRFREDLFFRIGRPVVRLPPLRERREEIPRLIAFALGGRPPVSTATGEFIEACMVRPWPGNVRELLAEVRSATLVAREAGRKSLALEDLDDEAGCAIEAEEGPVTEVSAQDAAPSEREIEAALSAERGNVARAAARLGISRSRMRRFIERRGIDVESLRSGE